MYTVSEKHRHRICALNVAMARDLSCLHSNQSGSRAHQAFYSMGTRGSLLGDEVVSAYLVLRLQMSGALPPLPHVPIQCPQGQLYFYSNRI